MMATCQDILSVRGVGLDNLLVYIAVRVLELVWLGIGSNLGFQLLELVIA